MQAGRELDALVAEKVMGWTAIKGDLGSMPDGRIYVEVPYYSTAIAAAWGVVEKCKYEVWIRCLHGSCEVRVVDCGHEITRVDADTAPLAICLAALKAVGYELPQEAA